VACFTDQENDPESGLQYFGARYYDPWVGRFMSQDPALIGNASGVTFGRIDSDPQQFNAYSYALNRPTIMVDEDGKFAILVPAVTGLIGGVAGAAGNAIGQVVGNLASGQSAFSDFSFSEVGVAAGVGFVAGAAAPFVATTTAGAVVLGSTANVAQTGINSAISGEAPTAGEIVVSAATGAVGGAIGGKFTAAGGKVAFDEASPDLSSSLARSINESAELASSVRASNLARNALGATASNMSVPGSDSGGTTAGAESPNSASGAAGGARSERSSAGVEQPNRPLGILKW
jgi:RHS repeat-associated protein